MQLEIINEVSVFIEHSKVYLKIWLLVLGAIWCLNIFNWLIGSRLNVLGIYPRHPFGLIGIFFAPLIHYDFAHLFFNSIPLFVLGLILLTEDPHTFYWITFIITGLSGLAVWLFGRKAIHIGASGVISGYFGYILMIAYKQPSLTSILLAILVLYYFGGILLGLFPAQKKVSWESHLFGFLSGVLCAYLPIKQFFI